MEQLQISALPIEALTKTKMLEISESLTSRVLNNEVSAIAVDIQLKSFEEIIKTSRIQIESKVKDEVVRSTSYNGVKIDIRNGYATYDYEQDETYASLKKQLKEREELLKQSAKTESQLVIDGEEIPKVPVKSYSKDSIVYSFEK